MNTLNAKLSNGTKWIKEVFLHKGKTHCDCKKCCFSLSVTSSCDAFIPIGSNGIQRNSTSSTLTYFNRARLCIREKKHAKNSIANYFGSFFCVSRFVHLFHRYFKLCISRKCENSIENVCQKGEMKQFRAFFLSLNEKVFWMQITVFA